MCPSPLITRHNLFLYLSDSLYQSILYCIVIIFYCTILYCIIPLFTRHTKFLYLPDMIYSYIYPTETHYPVLYCIALYSIVLFIYLRDLIYSSIFSCPEQLYTWPCWSVSLSAIILKFLPFLTFADHCWPWSWPWSDLTDLGANLGVKCSLLKCRAWYPAPIFPDLTRHSVPISSFRVFLPHSSPRPVMGGCLWPWGDTVLLTGTGRLPIRVLGGVVYTLHSSYMELHEQQQLQGFKAKGTKFGPEQQQLQGPTGQIWPTASLHPQRWSFLPHP